MDKQTKLAVNLQQDFTEAEKAQGRSNLGLAESAATGSYNDLIDKPVIGNGTTILSQNGSEVGRWSANQTNHQVLNFQTATRLSDLINDEGFITLSDLPPEKVFIAEYGVSTYAELLAAYNAHKAIILVGADFGTNIHPQMTMYDYNTSSGMTPIFRFAPTVVPRVATYNKYYASLDANGLWTKDFIAGTYPQHNLGIVTLSGSDETFDLIQVRPWLSNGIGNFDIGYFCTPSAGTLFIDYVDQQLNIDIVGTKRTVRSDLKSQIDATTTVQYYVTSVDVENSIVMTGNQINSSNTRLVIATLGPQEQTQYAADITFDLDIFVSQVGVSGSSKKGYKLRFRKFGNASAGHNYICATLAASDFAG